MSIKIPLYRLMCARSDRKRDKGLKTPDNIQKFDNLRYGENKKFHTLDVYRPKDRACLLPLIVHAHGGGYVYGSTELYQHYCMDLALRGFCVINFNYRLAPKYKFPSPLEDLNLVMEWACENARGYNFDLNNVFIAGDSAGAQIASQYAAVFSNPDYAKKMEITPPKFRLAALGLNCGLYDLINEIKNNDMMKILCDAYFTKDPSVWKDKIDVLSHITSNYPPVFIMSSPGDFLFDRSGKMADFLKAKGVQTVCKIYGDEKTYHVFHVDTRSSLAKQANDGQIEFFMRYLN